MAADVLCFHYFSTNIVVLCFIDKKKMFQKLWFIFCLCWLMGIVIPKYISSSNNDNNNHNNTQKEFSSQNGFPSNS